MPDTKASSGSLWNKITERFPLTWEGGFLLLVSVSVLWFLGVMLEDWILLVLGLFGTLLVILSSLSVGGTALYLHWRLRSLNEGRRALPIFTDTSKPAISNFLLPRLIPPFVDFFGIWESPDAEIAPLSLFPERTEEVRFAKRGRFDEIVRLFEVRDLFGLARVKWRMIEAREIEVWPQEHSHPAPFIRSFSDGDDMYVPNRPRCGDRVDIRQYQPGDSIRLIHWKLFARSNEPFVRIPESAASFEKEVMAFLVSDEDDEFAAAVARFDLERGNLGKQWLFGADRGDEVASVIHVARRVLALSGTRPARYGADLESFLQKAAFKADQHRLIVYASGSLHRWLSVMEPMLRKYSAVILLIIANQMAPSEEAWKTSANPKKEQAKPKGKAWEPWVRLFLRPEEKAENSSNQEPWNLLRELTHEGLQLQMLQPPQSANPPASHPPGARPHPKSGRRAMRSVPPQTLSPHRKS